MDSDQKATAALDEAAAEAVVDQEIEVEQEEEAQPAESQETDSEVDNDGLPIEHKERSDLGRKVSAYHRRMDELDQKFDRIMNYLETSQKEDPLEGVDEHEPLTRADLEKWEKQRDLDRSKKQKDYNDAYKRSIGALGTDLDDDQWKAVVAEMNNFTYDPTENPDIDARMNFERAEKLYWKKLAAGTIKENPLKGKKPDGKLGVATSQNSVSKEASAPKLDANAQSYIDYVRMVDGDDKADKLVKGMK